MDKRLWGEKIEEADRKEAFDLDHTFILRNFPKKDQALPAYRVSSEVVKSFSEDEEILSALSDHHAINTTISV